MCHFKLLLTITPSSLVSEIYPIFVPSKNWLLQNALCLDIEADNSEQAVEGRGLGLGLPEGSGTKEVLRFTLTATVPTFTNFIGGAHWALEHREVILKSLIFKD